MTNNYGVSKTTTTNIGYVWKNEKVISDENEKFVNRICSKIGKIVSEGGLHEFVSLLTIEMEEIDYEINIQLKQKK